MSDAPICPDTHDFLYARVKPGEAVLSQMLNYDGIYLSSTKDTLIFRAYAQKRADVDPTLKAVRGLALALTLAADDLEKFADEFTFKDAS